MTTGIVYLDIDDEITSAAARVRSSESRRVALVLPYGSRVATSRINFRLLSRDALISEKQLAVVAGDPATRALAASAGLPVFSSVTEYESSFVGLEAEPEPPAPAQLVPPEPPGEQAETSDESRRTTRAGEAKAAKPVASQETPALRLPPTPAEAAFQRPPARPPTAPRAGASPQPPIPPTRRGGSRLPLMMGLAVVGLVLLVVGVGAYVLLPSASIVVTPQPEPVAAVQIVVTADPAATEPNAQTNVVPAVLVPLDVKVNDLFPATGKRVEETKATGRVRFSNLDFLRTNTIPAGSVVSTNAGVRFRTNSSVTVPKADLVGLTVFPGRITVGVTALAAGLAANVEPNTIVIVPKGEDPQALKVVNPDATTGGSHQEFPKIVQADIDAALKKLSTALDAQFQTQLSDPSIVPPGATVFRDTASLGASTPSVDPATLVDQELPSFDLGLSASGSVITVDPSPVSKIAEQMVRTAVKADHELVAGSIVVSVGKATVSGGTVSFPATATAKQVAVLDPGALRTLVLGKSLDDARAILAQFGDVRVTAWPDWVGSIPTVESRVSVSIDTQVPVETPAPSGSS